jgi:DNA (cytosine-5)-methyltransferase 1
MAHDFLLRDVPPSLFGWIKEESHQRRTSMHSFVKNVLQRAAQEQLSLIPPDEPAVRGLVSLPDSIPFSFIDLFAGIGGLRLGLEAAGGSCVFSCEWDKSAQKTYKAWFGELPVGDIREVKMKDIPPHMVLAAGFPCQPFSIAGVSKKNSLGRAHGFKDETQGTLFFHLASVIEIKRPPVILLENVKNLKSHDGGRTWEVIQSTLIELGYVIFSRVINAAPWVPQHRERVFIVGFDRRVFGENPPFEFPEPPDTKPEFRSILDPVVEAKYTLSDKLWTYLQEYARKHQEKGNGFGFGLTDLSGVSRTLSARYYKDGSEVLIPQGKGKNPRRLTPREAARLMGFPDSLPVVVADTPAYKQFGNAVVPPVAAAVAAQIARVIGWKLRGGGNAAVPLLTKVA